MIKTDFHCLLSLFNFIFTGAAAAGGGGGGGGTASKMASKGPMEATQKMKNLRRRLDQLGYKEALAIESLPLVERLFVDLVKTIEDLRKSKVDKGKKDDGGEDNSAAECYKNDNAKLVKENLALNQKLIKQKEEYDVLVNGKFLWNISYDINGIKIVSYSFLYNF